MPAPTSPLAPGVIGAVHESDQEIHLDGVTTHTRARAVRAPWWAVLLVVQLGGGDEAMVKLVEAFLS